MRSASRLEQALRGILDVDVHIREREGMWLDFEDADLSRIGQSGVNLGQNSYLGARAYSINDKAVIELRARSREEYNALLPGGTMFARLADMVRFYLGDTVDFDVAVALPLQERHKRTVTHLSPMPSSACVRRTKVQDFFFGARKGGSR